MRFERSRSPRAPSLAAIAAIAPSRKCGWLIAVGILWLAGVAVGVRALSLYSTAPGITAKPPARWPTESAVARVVGRATLVMLAHPDCPCTRASIGELALLMARVPGLVSAHVLFGQAGSASNLHHSDLWWSAANIPGVTAVADRDGREAHLFATATSGQTLLYDAGGALLFSGGITGARGHSGDNAGRAALTSLLLAGESDRIETPVFGCPLVVSAVATDGALECRP